MNSFTAKSFAQNNEGGKNSHLVFRSALSLSLLVAMTLPSFATTDTKDGLKTPDVSLSAISQQSKKTVNGQILDSTGLPIPGANIRVKDSTVGTISDADGKFSLEVPNNSTLVISYIGYQTKEIPASAKNFKITLSEDTEALEEVVVVGYGTARKKDVSGSIANVKFDGGDITTLPNPNAIAALSSKVAGIKYAPTNSASGNNMGSMTIRGKNAIPQSATTSSQSVNQPLLIVDGVISYGSINEINTNDIQSIDVMKDASAAAIYGSRAANGVIIITTRGGQSEKPTINLNTSWSFSDWARMPKMVSDSEKFLKNRFYSLQAAGKIDGSAVYSSDFDKAQLLNATELDAYNEGQYVNWLDEISRTGLSQKYDVNISGKSKFSSYYVSGNYTNTKGIKKGDDYEKYNILSKIDIQAKSWLKIGLKGNFLSSKSGGISPRIQNATWMSPYSYVYSRQEGYENWYNSKPDGATASPYWGSGENDSYLWTDYSNHNYNVNGVAYAQIDFPFVKGLTYRITLNGQRNTVAQDLFNNPELWVSTDDVSQMADPTQFNSKASGYSVSSMTGTWNVDNILTYTKDIAKHHVDAMLGYTREASNNEYLKSAFSNFSSPTILGVYKQDLATTKTLSRTRSQSSSIAYLGRVNYNYDNKYYGTFNFRRDGYSAFAEGHKWGNFYGASAAWILSNESFIKDNTDLFDFLKLRLSWGQNGSRSVSPYATLATVSTTYTWFGDSASGSTMGLYPTSLPNRGLTWATVEKLNLGVDFSILNSRLDGSIDIYKGNTKNMLMARSVPYPTGFQSAYDNVGKVTNKGIEISLNSTNINGDGNKNLRWTTNLTFDLNRNKIVSLYGKNYEGVEADDVANALAYGFDNYYAMVIGEAIGAAYDYKKLGVFQSQEEIDNYTWTDPKTGETKKIQPNAVPGDLKFQDYNNDGQIDSDDRHYLGSMDPLFTVNLGNTFTWKNFSLYFNLRWMQGDDTHFLGFDPNAFGTSMSTGAQLDAIEPWTETNHTNKYPRYGYSNSYGYLYWNSRSFLKLKDLVFSYNVNPSFLKKLDISALRVFLSGTDLFTITKWSGIDPENAGTIASGASSSRYGSNGTYRTVSIGLNLSF